MSSAPEILFQDEFLVFCVKPRGIISEDGGMPELLSRTLRIPRLYCVHRLDKAAGGVMVYARDGRTAASLSEAISSRRAEKTYLAVISGRPHQTQGSLEDLLFHDRVKNKTYVVRRERRGVKRAALDYRLLSTVETEDGPLSLVSITLHTGRSHQIRVQFASRAMPLVGDGKYGSSVRSCGLALWSCFLSLPHPVSGESIGFSSTPPRVYPWSLFEIR